MEAHLSGRHRDTVEKIFSQSSSRNIEWREVVSLLEAIGNVTHEHNGKLKVTLGPETETLSVPHEQAGFGPDDSPAIADQSTRDHGDGQWGEPT
jgi:hypothetical protein